MPCYTEQVGGVDTTVMNDVIVYESGNGLYINLTNRCPCDCVFCIRKKKESINDNENLWLSKEPTYDEITEAIDDKKAADFSEIVFCGFGEPTERLDALLETARYIKEKNPGSHIRLNTNGLSDLINKKPTAKDLSANIDSISISLNVPNKEDYVKTCRPAFGEKSFDAIINFALECKKHFKDVCFSTVDAINGDKTNECKKICDELRIRLRIRTNI